MQKKKGHKVPQGEGQKGEKEGAKKKRRGEKGGRGSA